jgi:hypothetical protein
MTNITRIAPPKFPATDLHYETDCKAALDPMFCGLLDMAEAAGWDRRKAAWTLMYLAARHVTDGDGASSRHPPQASPDRRASQT